MKPEITLKDIAKIAKVSATAVSLALNNRPGVSEKTRRRILKIAGKLDYHPSYVAKTLLGKRSHTIGLIITNIADAFYAELALGIEEHAAKLGYSVLMYNTGGSLTKERDCLRDLRARGVDGVLLSTVTTDDPNMDSLIKDRLPFVLVNRYSMDSQLRNKLDYVVLDNYSCGYQAIEHFYRLGHNRVAVIAGSMNVSTALLRTKGATQAMERFGLDQDSRLIVECGYEREKAYEVARRMIAARKRPTAFFAQDDNMAIGVREAVLSSGLRIPEDVSLIGVDNSRMAAITGVDLTTVSQNIYEMGKLGTKLLVDKIMRAESSMVNQVIMEARLIVRKSCGFQGKGYVR
jgi:LacI family transcriptional regulator